MLTEMLWGSKSRSLTTMRTSCDTGRRIPPSRIKYLRKSPPGCSLSHLLTTDPTERRTNNLSQRLTLPMVPSSLPQPSTTSLKAYVSFTILPTLEPQYQLPALLTLQFINLHAQLNRNAVEGTNKLSTFLRLYNPKLPCAFRASILPHHLASRTLRLSSLSYNGHWMGLFVRHLRWLKVKRLSSELSNSFDFD